jgi:hypothetical protein
MVGVGIGALAYWGLRYVPVEVPFPGLAGTHGLDALPAVFTPAIAGVYGALVELDNTEDAGSGGAAKQPRGAKARVALDEDVAEEEAPARARRKKKRSRA